MRHQEDLLRSASLYLPMSFHSIFLIKLLLILEGSNDTNPTVPCICREEDTTIRMVSIVQSTHFSMKGLSLLEFNLYNIFGLLTNRPFSQSALLRCILFLLSFHLNKQMHLYLLFYQIKRLIHSHTYSLTTNMLQTITTCVVEHGQDSNGTSDSS